MARMDFKEYTRIRDIVVKRNKRAVAAGLAAPVHFPTVKEIRSGFVDAGQALRAVQGFYSAGSTVKAIRQTKLVPQMPTFPVMPAERKLSADEKKERKRAADRAYRQRRKIRDVAINPEKARKYEGYLKALKTVTSVWKKAGFDLGLDLGSMTPQQAQAFVEYMDYRFSQGDFNQRYVIDEFIQDFSKLMKQGYKGSQITKDFENFLEERSRLSAAADSMEGMSNSQIMSMWDQFVNRE